MYFFALR